MYFTTNESISSAINYGASLKQPVAFACLVHGAPRIRRDIEEGRVQGISFPAPPKPKGKYTRTETSEDRRETVMKVNRLRHEGPKAR